MARLHRISYRPGDTVVFEREGRVYQGIIGAVEVGSYREPKDIRLGPSGWTEFRNGPAKVSILLTLETFNDVTTAAEIG